MVYIVLELEFLVAWHWLVREIHNQILKHKNIT